MWEDCKVAFGYDGDEDKLWARDERRSLWPPGWSLTETDGAGARLVAIFRVEGVPSPSDGAVVRRLLRRFARRDRACVRRF